MAMIVLPVEHAAVRSTVRLLCGKTGAEPATVGTGFFYKVIDAATDQAKLLIITNKHVVRGCEEVRFVLSAAASVAALSEQQQPVGRTEHEIRWPLHVSTIHHPDPLVDLCAIDVTGPVAPLLASGLQLRVTPIDVSWLPTAEDRALLRDLETAIVVGYPLGLWDQYNNMPIARVGTTATHPLARYEGQPNFLVDVPAFHGSSGSPVFSYETPLVRDGRGGYTPGTKVRLIGIIWGVIERDTQGVLKTVEIPVSFAHVPVVSTPLNLAQAVHAHELLEIDSAIRNVIRGMSASGA